MKVNRENNNGNPTVTLRAENTQDDEILSFSGIKTLMDDYNVKVGETLVLVHQSSESSEYRRAKDDFEIV